MASPLVRGVSIDDAKIWKGGHRLVYADLEQSMPAKIEDVINLSTYALKTGWNDFGPTSDDGFKITREWSSTDGIAVDQRDYKLKSGGIQDVKMGGSCTSVYTDYETLQIVWELDPTSASTIAASAGVNVAQAKQGVGNPSTLTQRRLAILQMNDDSANPYVRLFVFRKAVLNKPAELNLAAKDPSKVEAAFDFLPDTSVTDGTDFGLLFEQTA